MSDMQRNSRLARLWFVSGVVALLVQFTAVGAFPAESEATTSLDCGVNALFILLRLEGRPVTFDRLESALPPRPPEGYSMAELATAAGAVGLSLEGVTSVPGDKTLFDRPAIAFLKDAEGGHFVVLRMVGTTGTMVQVIDPPHAPWIADYDRILAAKQWTSRILVPQDSWIMRYGAGVFMALAGVILIALSLAARLRSSPRLTTRA